MGPESQVHTAFHLVEKERRHTPLLALQAEERRVNELQLSSCKVAVNLGRQLSPALWHQSVRGQGRGRGTAPAKGEGPTAPGAVG